MKWIASVMVFLFIAAMLVSCGGKDGADSSPSSAFSDTAETAEDSSGPVETDRVDGALKIIGTPYCDICIPAEYDNLIATRIDNRDPYTLVFYDAEDETDLFTLLFGEKTNISVGKTTRDGVETEVFAEFAKLDENAENYDRHLEYQ